MISQDFHTAAVGTWQAALSRLGPGAECQMLTAAFPRSKTHLPSRSRAGNLVGQECPTHTTRAETEDDRLRKDPQEVLATNPSRNAVPESEAPWPRPIPAKCLLLLGYRFGCRTRSERFNVRPATLLSTVVHLYHQPEQSARGGCWSWFLSCRSGLLARMDVPRLAPYAASRLSSDTDRIHRSFDLWRTLIVVRKSAGLEGLTPVAAAPPGPRRCAEPCRERGSSARPR